MSELESRDCAETTNCPPNAGCPSAFSRVRVRPTIRLGTWIEWRLNPHFDAPRPYTFQLQQGTAATTDPTAWNDVGLSADDDSTFLIDGEQRVFGQTQWTHYRIKLTADDDEIYYSDPVGCWGDLPFRYQKLWEARLRTWIIHLKSTVAGCPGYLLKRKVDPTPYDVPCPGDFTDFLTGQVVRTKSPDNVATPYFGGYYAAIPCSYAELEPIAREEDVDEQGVRGTVNDQLVTRAKFLAVPQIDSHDVWVESSRDFRWEIRGVKHIEAVRGIPVVVEAELYLLPFSDVVYGIDIPGLVVGS